MKAHVPAEELTDKEKKLLFWASFLSLTAAGFGFSFRVAKMGDYGAAFDLTNQQIGQVFGASLWPIAITMIGGSLLLDKVGFKMPMFVAFALQAISSVGTATAGGYTSLYLFAFCAGLGHGIVEAVINPVCAAVYPKDKTKMLTILHAAWPAGLVFGTLPIITADWLIDGLSWKIHSLWMLIPVIAYMVMYLPCKFPVDERIKAGVSYLDMLKQVGFLSAFLAGGMMIYEIGNQVDALTGWTKPDNWFYAAMGMGAAVGVIMGGLTKSFGKPLFFLMCCTMIPVATAELATDGWIKKLMTPVLSEMKIDAAFALVFSAFIMLILRMFAGSILHFFSPPALLCLSGLGSAIGLFWLSEATGIAVFLAFVCYAMGQTYYWPCVLGFVSERYPEGGALTLNTVSACGLLSVGIIGGPLLGVAFDKSIYNNAQKELPQVVAQAEVGANFLWMKHKAIDPAKKDAFIGTLPEAEKKSAKEKFTVINNSAGRDVLVFAAWFPCTLILVFGAIALYFKSQGGYKPVELSEASGGGGGPGTEGATTSEDDDSGDDEEPA